MNKLGVILIGSLFSLSAYSAPSVGSGSGSGTGGDPVGPGGGGVSGTTTTTAVRDTGITGVATGGTTTTTGFGISGTSGVTAMMGGMVLANPAFNACVHPPSTPYDPNNPPPADAAHYPCVPQPVVPAMTAANWNAHVANGAGKEITGVYKKDGMWCGGAGTPPSALCPIQVLAFVKITCDPTKPGTTANVGGVTRCNMLDTYSINSVVQTGFQVPGMPPFKPIIVGPGGAAPVVIPAASIISTIFSDYVCPNGGVATGKDKYGYPVCDGGAIANQLTTDTANIAANAAQAAADKAALQKQIDCLSDTTNVMQSGGCTSKCDNQVCKYKLAGKAHFVDDCKVLGALVDLAGNEVPNATSDQSTFCKITSNTCPNGWNQMKTGNALWSTTDDGSNYPSHPGQDKDYCNLGHYGTDNSGAHCNSCISSVNYGWPTGSNTGNHTSDQYAKSGSHSSFSAVDIGTETVNYVDNHHWGHNCQHCDPGNSNDGPYVHTCAPVITSIGCW